MNGKELKFMTGVVLIVIALSNLGAFSWLTGIGGAIIGRTIVSLVLIVVGIWLIVISKRR